jgi:hypothetical protein
MRKTRRVWWAVVAVVLVAAAAWAGRVVMANKASASGVGAGAAAATSAAAAASTPQGIDLSAGDVARASRAELSTLLAVSGSLKATQSAFVKARVACVRVIVCRPAS